MMRSLRALNISTPKRRTIQIEQFLLFSSSKASDFMYLIHPIYNLKLADIV